MPSPQIKILLSIAAVSIVYAFVCEIRLISRARKISSRLQKERPHLWLEMNIVARNWNGGLPALKVLHRRGDVDLPDFDLKFKEVRVIEWQLLWGVVIGATCIFLVFVGLKFLGWSW